MRALALSDMPSPGADSSADEGEGPYACTAVTLSGQEVTSLRDGWMGYDRLLATIMYGTGSTLSHPPSIGPCYIIPLSVHTLFTPVIPAINHTRPPDESVGPLGHQSPAVAPWGHPFWGLRGRRGKGIRWRLGRDLPIPSIPVPQPPSHSSRTPPSAYHGPFPHPSTPAECIWRLPPEGRR